MFFNMLSGFLDSISYFNKNLKAMIIITEDFNGVLDLANDFLNVEMLQGKSCAISFDINEFVKLCVEDENLKQSEGNVIDIDNKVQFNISGIKRNNRYKDVLFGCTFEYNKTEREFVYLAELTLPLE